MQRFFVSVVCGFALLCARVEASCSSSDSPAKTKCKHGAAVCSPCIRVSWLIRPPFTFKRGNTSAGILPGILRNLYSLLCLVCEHPSSSRLQTLQYDQGNAIIWGDKAIIDDKSTTIRVSNIRNRRPVNERPSDRFLSVVVQSSQIIKIHEEKSLLRP